MSRRGRDVLNDPRLNRGTAFTAEERERLGLTGLLPPARLTLADQVVRVRQILARKPSDLERYVFLMSLLDRSETLFYRTVVDHLPELLPIVYTPTVGQAARQYGNIYRRPRGLYVTAENRGRVRDVLANWEERDVRVVVVTDGSRILGLGDLGANGMSISIGKLVLYSAAGGIDPGRTLPVMLDAGTNNPELLADPLYLGLRRERLEGEAYLSFVDEFMEAVSEAFPAALVQFEDFVTPRAFALLERYRERYRMFNDDIQGTAAVGLAGLLAAGRLVSGALADGRYLFVGAGSANTGIADLLVKALVGDGLTESDARRRCWFADEHGLVTAARPDVAPHAAPYAHAREPIANLADIVRDLRPTALIGATGAPGIFGEPVLRAMADVAERPIVFALSNPTDRSEVTARDAYTWTAGRAVFASGSPFDPVVLDGRRFESAQANNVYVFPGIGLAVTAFEIERVTDEMFLAAAGALARAVSDDRLAGGALFPPLDRMREVSAGIAADVGRAAFAAGLARAPEPEDPAARIRELMYEPVYDPLA